MSKLNIAGVVLAGGKSSRMGQSKALLDYNGKPLLDHMVKVLSNSNVSKAYVSGDFDGYQCIPDVTPHEGPARAILHVMALLKGYDGVLFIPVDMPFLTPQILNNLLSQKEGAYFENHPLPVFIKRHDALIKGSAVHQILNELNVPSIALPKDVEGLMKNANTLKDWKEILGI